MSAHVTDSQLTAFLDGSLPADAIVSVDAHLAACVECRARAAAASRGAVTRLARRIEAEGRIEIHPDDDTLADFVDGGSADGAEIERHLAVCQECAMTVRDLRVLQAPGATSARPRWLVPGLAAAAALLLAASLWWPRQRTTSPHPPLVAASELRVRDADATLVVRGDTVAGLDRLSAVERSAIAGALASGQLPPIQNVTQVTTEPGRLMGDRGSASAFAPLAPIATAVDTDRPTFRWSARSGARSFVVTIVDDTLKPVTASPRVTGTSWQPPAPLARGRVYLWQIRALVGTGTETVPAPPEPEARFMVLGADQAGEVAALRARMGGSHVAAILLAQYGLLQEAEDALSRAAAENPSVDSLRRLAAAARVARTKAQPGRR